MTDQVGKYFVLLKDGNRSGGLSQIRKGVDTRDGTFVAVKFIVAATDALEKKVFERETRALRNLAHPNIVPFRDAGIDETGTYYMVLDWIDRSLDDVLGEQPLPWNGWDEFYTQMAHPLVEALAFTHLQQYEHRDIKPANILVNREGAPLLADFGIAKVLSEQPHSELTVQQFRSGVYAPPEREAPISYVRDVYSIGVLFLQCLSESPIRDFPDVAVALDSVAVPPDVRRLLEACVNPDPYERPKNGSELASEFKKLARQQIARREPPHNPLWLDLTRTAQQHLAGEPADRSRAAAKLQVDLSGELFAEFGTDMETGRRTRDFIRLFGVEHRYNLKVTHGDDARLLVTAAPAVDLEVLEGGRRHGMQLPPVFSWTVHQPGNSAPTLRARHMLIQMLEDFYERQQHASDDPREQDGDDLFDLWLRILEAREDLARGENRPLVYTKARVEGRRTSFTVKGLPETDLVGTDWEVIDQNSNYRFGHGEVIDQDGDQIVLLARRPLAGLPQTASLVPYDAPSSISLQRQRNAVMAVRNGMTPGADLRNVLVNPGSNATPVEQDVEEWSTDLDPVKQRAVKLALGAPDVLLIQGPPGTGKTRFITETVIQALKRQPSARILIASQTHVAVDNAVERLHAAGVTGLVRLAGANEAVVADNVRELLLEGQTRRWAQSVRSRARNASLQQAEQLSVPEKYLRAALALQQLVEVTMEYEAVQQHVSDQATQKTTSSELVTAVEDEDETPMERFQARLDQLSDRRTALAEEAHALLAGDLTIPDQISSSEARHAIDLLIGTDDRAVELLKRLELQAAWLGRIDAEESLTSIYLAGASVVAGTCTGFLRHKSVAELEFDLCIVDEASKATATEVLIPISRAKRWILVGDTHQLPPTDEDLLRSGDLLNEYSLTRDDVTATLFQRLVDRLPEHSQLTLLEQYRMVRPIGDLISTCFYDGRLRSPNTEGLQGYDKVMGRAVTWIDTGPLGESRREQGKMSYANREEARCLIRQLDTIDQAIDFGLIKVPAGTHLEVLVIAPYKRQVEELGRRLAPKSYRHLNAVAMSVDQVQGREADLALLSLTRSNTNASLGFLGADYWRRINVALSRARYGLTIIGDAGFIKGTDGALRTVLDYIRQHPADCEVRLADRD